jgi:Mg2+/citrate symporter
METRLMEDILALLIPIIAVGGVFTLIAMKMRYGHLEEQRLGGSSQQEGEHLADAVDNLRAEFGLLQSEVEKLNERVEFTERLLERPKTEGELRHGIRRKHEH